MRNRMDELEESILLSKLHALPDHAIIQSLEHPLSGNEGFSKEEIHQAFQNLHNYGCIDKDGLITEQGIDALN